MGPEQVSGVGGDAAESMAESMAESAGGTSARPMTGPTSEPTAESSAGPAVQPMPGFPQDANPYSYRSQPQGPYQQQPYPASGWSAAGPQPRIPYGYAQNGYPPGNHPPNPYGYPPYLYGPPPVQASTSGLAVASLVVGICGFMAGFIGLILGIVALSSIKKSGQRGRGMAVAGIVLSSLWTALMVAGIIAVAFSPEGSGARPRPAASSRISVYDLGERDCFTAPNLAGADDDQVAGVTLVPCSQPHDSEVFGSFSPSADSYPGVDALHADGSQQCVTMLAGYVLDQDGLPAGTGVRFVFPDQQAWDHDLHRVTCYVKFPAPTVTQSVRGEASAYTPDQLRYLSVVRPLATAVARLDATPPTSGLPVLHDRAAALADAAADEIAALTTGPWPSAVQPAVDKVIAAHRTAAQHWHEAATAPDVDSYAEAVRQADAALAAAGTADLREGLGLQPISFVAAVQSS